MVPGFGPESDPNPWGPENSSVGFENTPRTVWGRPGWGPSGALTALNHPRHSEGLPQTVLLSTTSWRGSKLTEAVILHFSFWLGPGLGHAMTIQLVCGANYRCVLHQHHLSSLTRLKGSWGQLWPTTDPTLQTIKTNRIIIQDVSQPLSRSGP